MQASPIARIIRRIVLSGKPFIRKQLIAAKIVKEIAEQILENLSTEFL